jgi:hypothetical protein
MPPPRRTGVNPVALEVATLVCNNMVHDSTEPFALSLDRRSIRGWVSALLIGALAVPRQRLKEMVGLGSLESGHVLSTEVIQLLRAHRGVIDDDPGDHRLAPLGVATASFILGG